MARTSKRPGNLRGVLRSFTFCAVPVVGTYVGSPNYCNPVFIDFQIDEIFPNGSGGSEMSITPSSFAFERPLFLLR